MSPTKTRNQIETQYQWDTESLYASSDQWEEDFNKLDSLLEPIAEMRGQLDSATRVAQVFELEDKLGRLLEKVFLYAHMKEDEDTSKGESQAMMSRVRSKLARVRGELAWIQPEILKQPEKTLREWMDDPALADYRRSMELLIREKPHTLSTEEETLLGLASEIFGTPYDAFSKLTNADMDFPPAEDSKGGAHEVTNGTFYTLLLKGDRQLRENAFGSIYETYGGHRNSIASLLAGSTKTHVFKANVRHFDSSLEASLFDDNIPASVYTTLIDAVHEALPLFYEYVDLRAKRLELGEKFNMWDFYVPIVPDFEMEVSWDECQQWIRESLRPLGQEYMEGVEKSFSERWYDVFENKGKRSGAYSTGAYDAKPFMLLNYHGTLNDVFTVAHELGHSMHSYLSNRSQPYRYADYPIFLAEIASTTNEQLLHHYLSETQEDPRLRAYLLNHLCDSFKGTMFRQTMFAEFELEIHRRLEKGQALTAESLEEYYYDLNAKYYGPGFKADPRIAREWLRIPHFYYNFYVYKYATGFAAAQVFARQVLKGEEGRDKYLGFLKSGGSRDPLDIVRDAGVDLTDRRVLQQAFETFGGAVKELGGLLEKLPAKSE